MARNSQTSAIIDGLLKVGVTTGTLAVGLLLPNLIEVLDKPISDYLNKLDKRQREREVERIITYALREGLISERYQHGVMLTKKGERRLKQLDFAELTISRPDTWDTVWRLVMFDVPKKYDRSRRPFTAKLRQLGFQPLQQSVWIYPFACKEEVTLVARMFGIDDFVTYIETHQIDHEDKLQIRFKHLLTS